MLRIWLFLRIHSLTSSDGYEVYDIFNRTAAREIVNRTCDSLENRTKGNGIAKTLNELITDIAYLKVREHENVCLTSNL